MHVIVVGGAGFIGSHLCYALLEGGHAVTAIDNLVTGSRRNIAHLPADAQFRLIEHNIVDPLPSDIPTPDAIFHLASPASPIDFYRIPLAIQLTNSIGTYNVLEYARQTGAQLLFTSTSEVYGDPLVHPQVESYFGNVNPVGPRACYDEGKRFSESLVMTYVREYGLDGRIVRIFNTYGPHMNPDDGRAVPSFITSALLGRPIMINGEGSQTRSFCYVDDNVRGLLAVMFAPKDVACGRVYNVGNPVEHSVLELAELIRTIIGGESDVSYRPGLPEDPTRRRPDITRIRTEIGWEPRIPLEEGMKQTIDWFRTVVG